MNPATAPAVPTPADDEIVRAWPYRFDVVKLSRLIVDDTYQRPLTSFVDKIVNNYDPALVGTLVISGRAGGKYAVVDGQTRMEAMKELGLADAPCLVYTGLNQAQEASLFARLQKERRGIHSFHRFRAALVAGEDEPKAIEAIVNDCGYTIGMDKGEVGAVASLEYAYRRDPEVLERTLLIFKEAWPVDPVDATKEFVPDGQLIKGLAYLIANGVPGTKRKTNIDDQRLADRLRQVTPEQIRRRASALREGVGGGGSITFIAQALAAVYRKTG